MKRPGKPTRAAYLRRRVVAGVILVLVAGVGIYVPVALAAPLNAATASIAGWAEPTPRAPQELDTPEIGSSAIGAVGFDGLLAQSGSSDPVAIASISKVITALVVLEAKPLTTDVDGPTITFSAADAALYGKYVKVLGKVEPMRAGVEMTEREALEVVLISSANNYTEALAGWAFGSQQAFVDAAAMWIASHGLASTTIVEPTGMSPRNVSSAADLVRLGQLALQHPVVSAIVASPVATVPYIGDIENTNELLGIGGIDGIKTGTLDEAGSCLLFSTEYVVGTSTITVVGVVLGGVDHESVDAAVTALLAGVSTGFRQVTLTQPGQQFATFTTEWDDTSRAVATEAATVVVWSDAPITATVEVSEVEQTRAGASAGRVEFFVDGRSITVPLAFDDPIDDPGQWWRIFHPIDEILP